MHSTRPNKICLQNAETELTRCYYDFLMQKYMYNDLCALLRRKRTTQQSFLFRKQLGKKDFLDIVKGSRATFYVQLQRFLQKTTS